MNNLKLREKLNPIWGEICEISDFKNTLETKINALTNPLGITYIFEWKFGGGYSHTFFETNEPTNKMIF